MKGIDLDKNLEVAIEAAYKAGKEMLEVYDSDFAVEQKEDKSPLTEADMKSHRKIMSELEKTGLPVLSEEGRDIPFSERNTWDYFWMIDPLDGTKEFVKRNGEFTVNIALIHNKKPVLGVIYVPVKDVMYFGEKEDAAYKLEESNKHFENGKSGLDDLKSNATILPRKESRNYTVVASRSHMSEETRDFIDEVKKDKGEVDIISRGSSLKLCMVAEGKADAYPRFAPTMEWDTAAGQAIVEAAGGTVVNWDTKLPMPYNKENLLNQWFLVQL